MGWARWRGRGPAATFAAVRTAVARGGVHERELLRARLADTEQALAEAQERLMRDPLTGLPNRTLFVDRLEHALARARRSRHSLAVMFLDLDDFKRVNDTLGHHAGDQLLVALTPRLTGALRPGDTIARFAGDEFVVLCEDLRQESDAIQIAARISDACSGPVLIDGYEHTTTVSIGVLLVSDPDAANPAGVLRDADAAMYRSKARGKGRIEVFDERMRERLIERIEIESALARAIDGGQLRLSYRPVVSMQRQEVVAMEALVRWHHPNRAVLEAADFVPIAESTGLIIEIGKWVIGEACREAAGWREPVRVSINLSRHQIIRSDVAGAVAWALRETGLEPGLLELAIDETMLFTDTEPCIRTLRALKALGVRLVLDDFGTGYIETASQLTRLREREPEHVAA